MTLKSANARQAGREHSEKNAVMQAVRKTSPGTGVDLAFVSAPGIEKDEVLIRVHRASICGSDMMLYHWTSWAPERVKTPLVIGHEFCGTVVEKGAEVRNLETGDFISVESHIFCGACVPCRNGQRHVCQNLKIIGIDCPGGFAEYAAIPARCAWKHSDGSLRDVGSLMEPLGNAVYAALAEPVDGQVVLVTGCGPQGLFAIQVARASGARKVIAVEGSAFRRRLAEDLGADAVLDPADPGLRGQILAQAGADRGGVDAVLEMSGSPAAIEIGLMSLRNGGRLTAFGIPGKPIPVRWAEDLVFKGIRIYGIAGREIYRTWETMDRLLRSKAIDIRPVITHTYPLRDAQKAFETMASPAKDCGKVVIEMPA